MNLVEELRNNKYIKERAFGNISSFNFTRDAFEGSVWNDQTIMSRGLYINTVTNKIVARGFNKFFNIGEREETQLENLKTMKFPVTCYVKENGYLGLVSYNEETDDLFVTTKSDPTGDYSKWLTQMICVSMNVTRLRKMKEFCRDNDVTLVFEFVYPTKDPHIIEYKDAELFLLSIIKNDIKFTQYSYDEIVSLANDLGITCKKKAYVLNSYNEFITWYNTVTAKGWTYEGKNIEGFVIEDSEGYMVKVKLYYYKFWKYMRSIAQGTLTKGFYKREDLIEDEDAKEFYEFLKKLYLTTTEEERLKLTDNIIALRNKFYES